MSSLPVLFIHQVQGKFISAAPMLLLMYMISFQVHFLIYVGQGGGGKEESGSLL